MIQNLSTINIKCLALITRNSAKVKNISIKGVGGMQNEILFTIFRCNSRCCWQIPTELNYLLSAMRLTRDVSSLGFRSSLWPHVRNISTQYFITQKFMQNRSKKENNNKRADKTGPRTLTDPGIGQLKALATLCRRQKN